VTERRSPTTVPAVQSWSCKEGKRRAICRLWARLLGVERAVVERVAFDEDADAIVVAVRPRKATKRRCSRCGRRCPGFDQDQGRRRWRALDLGTVRAYLEADGRGPPAHRWGGGPGVLGPGGVINASASLGRRSADEHRDMATVRPEQSAHQQRLPLFRAMGPAVSFRAAGTGGAGLARRGSDHVRPGVRPNSS
jgi:hypothetical protein